ncbi:MAG TPA: DUF898 family protein [Stellaceae bacterium]|nr:DUF898 family protein [Stellaceae bacterium]
MTTTDAAGPKTPGAGTTTLVYDGRLGELFVLWLKVLLLGIITFGIYSRFWGKTRFRRYFWNHASLLGERFEYDGTGGELFRRFLLAIFVLPVLIALAFGLGFLLQGLGLPAQPAQVTGVVLYLGAFFFLFFVSQYGSRRYQLSRTVWSGIRGGVEGSAIGYALRAIGYTLLIPVTLGVATPWRDVALWRYKTSHSGFGDLDFRFAGTGRALLAPFLVAYAAAILGFVAAAGVAAAVFFATGGELSSHELGAQDVGRLIAAAVCFYLTYLIITIIGYLHYVVRSFAYFAENTSLGRVRFAFPVGKGELFWFQVVNFLLLIFTAGLALVFVAQRYVRFFCNHLAIEGAEELKALTQSPGRRRPRGGEGLAQLFDSLDVGGFI